MHSKTQEMLKLIDKFSSRHHRHEILADCFECWAISISNLVDHRQREEREKQYLRIVQKYDKHDLDIMAQLFAQAWLALTEMPQTGFYDLLGELYMLSDTSNKKAGQFFTPYEVSKLSAQLTLTGSDNLKEDIITISEPACGSGGMILACADTLQNDCKINYTAHSFVVAGDIDSRCVHMCYVQLALTSIPAVIEQRNALTNELLGGVWKTPALIFQYTRFRHLFEPHKEAV